MYTYFATVRKKARQAQTPCVVRINLFTTRAVPPMWVRAKLHGEGHMSWEGRIEKRGERQRVTCVKMWVSACREG